MYSQMLFAFGNVITRCMTLICYRTATDFNSRSQARIERAKRLLLGNFRLVELFQIIFVDLKTC